MLDRPGEPRWRWGFYYRRLAQRQADEGRAASGCGCGIGSAGCARSSAAPTTPSPRSGRAPLAPDAADRSAGARRPLRGERREARRGGDRAASGSPARQQASRPRSTRRCARCTGAATTRQARALRRRARRARLGDGRDAIDALFGHEPTGEPACPAPVASRSPTRTGWPLARLDVDLAAVRAVRAASRPRSPPSARARARVPAAPARRRAAGTGRRACSRRVAASFGDARRRGRVDREQRRRRADCAARAARASPSRCSRSAALRSNRTPIDPRELAFALARRLADLRTERIARLLVPARRRARQILELATSAPATAPAAEWLASTLHRGRLDQACAPGRAAARAAVHAAARARSTGSPATERAGDRIGLVVVGDLATCVRVLDREDRRRWPPACSSSPGRASPTR